MNEVIEALEVRRDEDGVRLVNQEWPERIMMSGSLIVEASAWSEVMHVEDGPDGPMGLTFDLLNGQARYEWMRFDYAYDRHTFRLVEGSRR